MTKRRSQARASKKKNPPGGKKVWPWLAGLAGAGVAAWGAYHLLAAPPTPTVPQQPQPDPRAGMHGGYGAQNGYPGGPWDNNGGSGQVQVGPGGVTGRDEHGIPEVMLPAESAARTMQARRYQQHMAQQVFGVPQLPAPQGYAGGAPAFAPQGTIPVESFGGAGETGTLGGENF